MNRERNDSDTTSIRSNVTHVKLEKAGSKFSDDPPSPLRSAQMTDVSISKNLCHATKSFDSCPGTAGVALYREGEDDRFYSSPALRSLVDVYLESAATGNVNLVLIWPGIIRSVHLTHVLATLEHWAMGNKRGLRGLLYPAKNNSFFDFNHLFVSREGILRWANELYERPGENNPLVKGSLPEKDAVLFKAGNTSELRPCVNELFPHFEKLRPDCDWQPYDDELLEHVVAKLRRRLEKGALRSNLRMLGDPRTAPDALFAVGYRLTKADVREALASLKPLGLPKVALVDATRRVRITIDGWRRRLSTFIEIFGSVFKNDRVGLVIVTDDPGICYQLKELLEKRLQKVQGSKRRPRHQSVNIHPIICRENGDGLFRQNEPVPLPPESRTFRIESRDSEASRLVQRLYKTAAALNLDAESAKPLRLAAAFIHKLSAFPSSLAALHRWLDERQADIRFREQFIWQSYRANLIQFIDEGYAGSLRVGLEKTLSRADKLARDYQQGTAIALKMASELMVALQRSKNVALVFTKPMLRVLAERFLTDLEFEGGRKLSDFQDRVQFLVTSQLKNHLETHPIASYLFVGIDDDLLRLLVTDNHIPSESVILLTHRAAVYMHWTLRHVLGYSEFTELQARAQMLLSQLTEQLGADPKSGMSSDDFLQPSFNFNVSSFVADSDIDQADAWRIELDDGQVLIRGETSAAYIYDPAKEDAIISGFRRVDVRDLSEGTQLFVMSEDLREMVEDYLRQAGVPISRDGLFEGTLRHYHERLWKNLAERFPARTRVAQVAAIREHIAQHRPEITDLPANIGYWIDLSDSSATPFDELTPQAPRRFAHFQAFGEALGLDPTEITWFWQAAIHPIRINRRIEGRHISDIYSKVLFDPESAIVHGGLSRKSTAMLYEKARENLKVIVSIQAPRHERAEN
jgi:hypothetical protein